MLLLLFLACSDSTGPSDGGESAREITQPTAATEGCDYLVVAASGMESPAAAFVEYRMRHTDDGVQDAAYVRYAVVDDSYGDVDTFPLRAMLQHADSTWTTAPKWVLLMGKMGIPSDSAVRYGWWDHVYAAEAPSGRLVRMVGRVPTDSPAQALALLRKVEAWEAEVPAPGVLLIADDSCADTATDIIGFAQAARDTRAIVDSAGIPTILVETADAGGECPPSDTQLAAARGMVHAALGSAPSFVTFYGHGSPECWTHEEVLTLADVGGVGRPSVYTLMACNTSEFTRDSLLVVELLFKPTGGAVATIGAPIQTWLSLSSMYCDAFYRHLVSAQATTVGEAFMAAFGDGSVSLNNRPMLLLGDPALRIR
jgi:hypothetical protein